LVLTDRAVAFCGFPVGAHLLDVGCGAGATVEHLCSCYGWSATGVDVSPRLIAEGLDRNPGLQLVEAPAGVLPFPGESQDGIFCECVLSLLEEPLHALAEFQRVLRSNGYLILADMYSREAAAEVRLDGGPRGAATRGQIDGWLSASGFSTLLWEDHTPLLRELAARLILAHGSLEAVCCGAGARPGYYLLVARKEYGEEIESWIKPSCE
jgi:ubiquinone/menaquinone biosynthesis C-methylase UbiE